jgi:hypothetical protein
MTIRLPLRNALGGRASAPAAPAFATRHRNFVARFLRGKNADAAGPVARIMRRSASHVIERMRMLTRFCLRIVERPLAPVVITRAPRVEQAPATVREIHRDSRQTLLERLVERRTHSIERWRVQFIEQRLGTVLRTVATDQRAVRIAPTLRIEARRAYPPVARMPARVAVPPKPASERRENVSPLAESSDRRSVTRFGGEFVAPEPLTLPHGELARVTEHVMQQLDRRALSYRERQGIL